MSILADIVAAKQKEVEERKGFYPTRLLEQSIFFPTRPLSLRKYLMRADLCPLVAEFKRKSPSKGMINAYAPVERTTIGYMQAGAAALSILTDKTFFGGTNEDLMTARKYNLCPILRKDFILDEYQVVESKSIGADVILLIASILDIDRVRRLTALAHELGMEVLLEIHNEEEYHAHSECEADVIGVNNRNLRTFEVSIGVSQALAQVIDKGRIKISESGLSSPATLVELQKEYGYNGFLMGENFMKHSRPEMAARSFVKEWKKLHETRQTPAAAS